jgi:hypothetical protein
MSRSDRSDQSLSLDLLIDTGNDIPTTMGGICIDINLAEEKPERLLLPKYFQVSRTGRHRKRTALLDDPP